MIAEFKITEIDYKSIAKLIQSSANVGKGLNSFIAMLIKSTELLPKSFINKVAIGLCNKNNELLASEINNIMEKNNINASVNDIFMKQEMEKVIIQACVSNVDYEEIIIHFMPQLISIIPENEKTAVILKALELLNNEREQMVRGILLSMNDAKKEEVVKLFVNAYSDKLCGLINNLMSKNDIIAAVEYLQIK